MLPSWSFPFRDDDCGEHDHRTDAEGELIMMERKVVRQTSGPEEMSSPGWQ
jgi:hypothetical protein